MDSRNFADLPIDLAVSLIADDVQCVSFELMCNLEFTVLIGFDSVIRRPPAIVGVQVTQVKACSE